MPYKQYLQSICDSWGEEQPNLEAYLNGIKPFFSVCENKTVLEIGPFFGWHTALVHQYNPKHVTLVEANTEFGELLKTKFTNDLVIIQDIFHFLEQNRKTDVVVCCGVLYHLHSPIYLLELIANRADPEYVILESVVKPSEIDDWKSAVFRENDNTPGNRYTDNTWKSARISIDYSQSIIEYVMDHLGYEIVNKDTDMSRFGFEQKKSASMTLYRKKHI